MTWLTLTTPAGPATSPNNDPPWCPRCKNDLERTDTGWRCECGYETEPYEEEG